MDAKELNELAITRMQSLSDHQYFDELPAMDSEMANHNDPTDKNFYQNMQDRISEIYGECVTAYYGLKAELKVYICIRKSQIKLECETKKEKLPAAETLEDLIKAEVGDLYKAVIIIEGWIARSDSSLKTARNHTYEGKEVTGENKEA